MFWNYRFVSWFSLRDSWSQVSTILIWSKQALDGFALNYYFCLQLKIEPIAWYHQFKYSMNEKLQFTIRYTVNGSRYIRMILCTIYLYIKFLCIYFASLYFLCALSRSHCCLFIFFKSTHNGRTVYIWCRKCEWIKKHKRNKRFFDGCGGIYDLRPWLYTICTYWPVLYWILCHIYATNKQTNKNLKTEL